MQNRPKPENKARIRTIKNEAPSRGGAPELTGTIPNLDSPEWKRGNIVDGQGILNHHGLFCMRERGRTSRTESLSHPYSSTPQCKAGLRCLGQRVWRYYPS